MGDIGVDLRVIVRKGREQSKPKHTREHRENLFGEAVRTTCVADCSVNKEITGNTHQREKQSAAPIQKIIRPELTLGKQG